MVAPWDDVTHVTTFHGVVTILIHQLKRVFQVAFVVAYTGTRLVVHHEFHALGVGIFVEIFQVEIRIRRNEIENITLPMVGPVFPTDVPSLHQHLVDTIGGCEIDILLHVGRSRSMTSVGLCLRPIDAIQLDRRIFIGVIP